MCPRQDGLVWKFDVDTGSDLLKDHLRTDLWPTVFQPPPWANMDFVMASKSSRWRDPEVAPHVRKLLQSPGRVNVTTLEGGHWIHVDNAAGVLGLLSATLGR